MSKPTLIFITQVPFSRRDNERFGIEILSKHFQVRVLDCTPLIAPDYDKEYSQLFHQIAGAVRISTQEQLASTISCVKGGYFIDLVGMSARSLKIRKTLLRQNLKRIVLKSGALPTPKQNKNGRFARFWKNDKKLTTIVNRTQSLVANLMGYSYDSEADITVVTGLASIGKRASQCKQAIFAHTLDYDIFLRLKDERKSNLNYAVFLDQDLIHHSEYLYTGERRFLDEDRYYASLNMFFSAFESKTGMKVIVAAHPRSNYQLRPHLLFGRSAKEGVTAELVRDASIVFAHFSTCIGFAVLWRKPVVLLKTYQFDSNYSGDYVEKMSEELGAPVVDISSFTERKLLADLSEWSSIDRDKYKGYVDSYLKYPGSPEVPLWEQFAEGVLRGGRSKEPGDHLESLTGFGSGVS